MNRLVIDNGSYLCRAGYAGDDEPRLLFRSKRRADGRQAKEGEYPPSSSMPVIERGVVRDWPGLEAMWQHAFERLQVDPTEHQVLLTEPPLGPRSNRERMAEIMLETFGASGTFIAIPAVLAMWSCGRNSALALECGHGTTHVVPICSGFAVRDAILRTNLAGADVTDVLARLLPGGHTRWRGWSKIRRIDSQC